MPQILLFLCANLFVKQGDAVSRNMVCIYCSDPQHGVPCILVHYTLIQALIYNQGEDIFLFPVLAADNTFVDVSSPIRGITAEEVI